MPRRSHVFLTRRVNVEGGHSKGIGMWRAGDSGREPRPPRAVCGCACWLWRTPPSRKTAVCGGSHSFIDQSEKHGNSRHQDPDAGAARTTYSHLIAEFGPQSSAPPPPPGNGMRRNYLETSETSSCHGWKRTRLESSADPRHFLGSLPSLPPHMPRRHASALAVAAFAGGADALSFATGGLLSQRPAVLCRQHSERACIICNRSNFC